METSETPSPAKPSHFGRALLWGTLSGWVLVFVPYLLTLAVREKSFAFLVDGSPAWVYNGSLLLLLPAIQGLVAGLLRGNYKQSIASGFGLVVSLWALDTLVAAIFLREGIICLIMAIPLLWPIIAIGYGVGRGLARLRRSRTVSVGLAPLALLAVVLETQGPLPDYHQAITDSVTVQAPADYVWRYVVDYPNNPNPPDYWLWQAGLPAPTHSVATEQKVGARRDCKFSGDHAFVERIDVLEPGKRLVFAITEQPQHPEIIGHITVDKGEIVLTENPDGTTTVTATSWYRLHVRPAGYFAWWAQDVTRNIHFRVLGYMKELAEQDYAAAHAKIG